MAEATAVTVEDIFHQAMQLEKEAEALYRRWEEAFASYPPVALLWREYAGEEAQHARLLEDILARLPAERRRQAAEREIPEALRRAQIVARRAASRPATVGEALMLASELENSEINAVLELLVQRFAPEMAPAMIHAQLQEHITKIDEHMHTADETTLGLKAVW